MAFCNQCGTQVSDDSAFCNACGARMNDEDATVRINPLANQNTSVQAGASDVDLDSTAQIGATTATQFGTPVQDLGPAAQFGIPVQDLGPAAQFGTPVQDLGPVAQFGTPDQVVSPVQEEVEPQKNVMDQVGETFNKGVTKLKALNDTADTTEQFDKNDIENNKLMGILAYLGILVLIPFFLAKDSKYVMYHVNQGLVLAIAGLGVAVVAIVTLLILPFLGIIFALIEIPFLVLMVMGILNVINGKAKELPIVGKYKILK